MNKLSAQDEAKVEVIKNNAEVGNVKKYIDGMNDFMDYHDLDLPTVVDTDAAIIDKHAILDIAKGYPKNSMTKYIKVINEHPDVEFWYKSDYQFSPLTGDVMKKLLASAISYVQNHYDSHDDEQNQNIHDSIGYLGDEIG